MLAERTKYVFKRDLDDDSDGVHLTSFGMEFQTEEEAKENERSPSVALLCAGLLRRGMVYELERVCDSFFCSMSATHYGAVLLWQLFIDEHMTKKNGEIAQKARLLRRQGKISTMWTKDCNVIMKSIGVPEVAKIHQMKNMNDFVD